MIRTATARERVLAALQRERVHPVPVGAVTQSATVAQMEATGAWWPEAHCDAVAMAELAAAAHALLGFDMVRVPFDQTVEAGLLGVEVDTGDAVSNCVVRSDGTGTLACLDGSLPDLDSGRARTVVQAIARLRGRFAEVAVIGGVVGPFTLICQLAGVSAVLMEAVRRPDALRPWLDFAVRVGVAYARRQVEAGADAICIEDMSASLDLTSPALWRTLILPAERALIARIDAPVILHVCGGNTRILPALEATGAAALSLDSRTDLAQAAALGMCAVIGGVPPVEVLLHGSRADVRRAAFDCLDTGVHILAPGCGVPPKTPVANLQEMALAAREWR